MNVDVKKLCVGALLSAGIAVAGLCGGTAQAAPSLGAGPDGIDTDDGFRNPPTVFPGFRNPPTVFPGFRNPPTVFPGFRVPPTVFPGFRNPPTV